MCLCPSTETNNNNVSINFEILFQSNLRNTKELLSNWCSIEMLWMRYCFLVRSFKLTRVQPEDRLFRTRRFIRFAFFVGVEICSEIDSLGWYNVVRRTPCKRLLSLCVAFTPLRFHRFPNISEIQGKGFTDWQSCHRWCRQCPGPCHCRGPGWAACTGPREEWCEQGTGVQEDLVGAIHSSGNRCGHHTWEWARAAPSCAPFHGLTSKAFPCYFQAHARRRSSAAVPCLRKSWCTLHTKSIEIALHSSIKCTIFIYSGHPCPVPSRLDLDQLDDR